MIPADSSLGVEVVSAIQSGDVKGLRTLLEEHQGLATARIVDRVNIGRSLLHVFCDWPGHRPNSAETIGLLIEAGSEVNATIPHPTHEEAHETPLHWAASNDDVISLDALLDGGANIEASGGIFTGGSPMSDAVVFAQWKTARRLLERGAKTTYWQASALGLIDDVKEYFESQTSPSPVEITNGFWNACRGGQLETAKYLLSKGANINWIGYDDKTPLAAAEDSGNESLIAFLRGL